MEVCTVRACQGCHLLCTSLSVAAGERSSSSSWEARESADTIGGCLQGKLHRISAVPEPDEVFLATVRSLNDAKLVDAAAAGIDLKPPPAEAAAAPPIPPSTASAAEAPAEEPGDRIDHMPQTPTPTGEIVAYENGDAAKVAASGDVDSPQVTISGDAPKAAASGAAVKEAAESTLKSHAVRLTSDTAAPQELHVDVQGTKTADEEDTTPFGTPIAVSADSHKEEADAPSLEPPVPLHAAVPATA